ncbi:prepilin peptidase [Porphyrobacter sp. ULC335]|uniref:A24 family peptidase n=1 Tax=Porphyrobacter sp. ULC335 TaxID=2854260 RepID=UPI002220B5D7|nr:prepilin peptidase [Porphyrobacter sp. ULC335]UYV17183.1 prepilin peptidase [Porphyrobacter sp. ULC335]
MSSISYGLLVALAIALVFAAFTDVRRRQIDNWLNAAIALVAPLFWWASGLDLWPGVGWQLIFCAIVSAILIGIAYIGYRINVLILGGGDIKLLAALSLWFTPLSYIQMLLVMSLFGGALAVAFVLRRVILKPKTPGRLPYGVAIAFGSLWVLATHYLPGAATAVQAA